MTKTPTPTPTGLSPTGSVCVSGAGSADSNGTYTYNGTNTINGVTRPQYINGSYSMLVQSVTGTTVWSMYNASDEGTHYYGNTTPAPQYPYLETSWRLAALGVLPVPTVNSLACP
jgi:hypothetical protein